MRLLKTHSHISERRGYETGKEDQVKKKERRPTRIGEKESMKITAISSGRGERGENVSTKSEIPK